MLTAPPPQQQSHRRKHTSLASLITGIDHVTQSIDSIHSFALENALEYWMRPLHSSGHSHDARPPRGRASREMIVNHLTVIQSFCPEGLYVYPRSSEHAGGQHRIRGCASTPFSSAPVQPPKSLVNHERITAAREIVPTFLPRLFQHYRAHGILELVGWRRRTSQFLHDRNMGCTLVRDSQRCGNASAFYG